MPPGINISSTPAGSRGEIRGANSKALKTELTKLPVPGVFESREKVSSELALTLTNVSEFFFVRKDEN